MATLSMRYGGRTVSLQEGFNFNPQNYGTKRLNVKVANNSTMRLGLTTNTNAKEYCGLAMRVGGQVVYIGRVSSTTYTSGDTPNRNGSSVGSSRTNGVESTELYTSRSTSNFTVDPAVSSLVHTVTYSQTKIDPRSYTVTTETQEAYGVTTSTAEIYEDEGIIEGSNRTIYYGTYSTNSEAIRSLTYYSFAYTTNDVYYTDQRTYSYTFGGLGNSKNIIRTLSKLSHRIDYLMVGSVSGTDFAAVKSSYNEYKNSTMTDYPPEFNSYYFTTTRKYTSSKSTETTYDATIGNWVTTSSEAWDDWWEYDDDSPIAGREHFYTRTRNVSYKTRQASTGSIGSTTKTSYVSRLTRDYNASWYTTKKSAIETLYRSSTKYYGSTSARTEEIKYTYETYTEYDTYVTSRTTNISETLHNMNL